MRLGHVLVPAVDSLVVLGSVVRCDGFELPAIRHRIAKAWGVYHKWAHVLTSKAKIGDRVAFWTRVVLPSLTWGQQTLREPTNNGQRHLTACQHMMLRKIIKVKRKPAGNTLDPWLDWQIRSLTAARDLARSNHIQIVDLVSQKRVSWASHLIRLGNQSGELHICKFLITWRPLSWWREQQIFNLISTETCFHSFGWGLPRRWENIFPADWMATWGARL